MTDVSRSAPTGTGPAEAACMTAVSVNSGGGRASVLTSEPAGAGSLVVLRSRDGINWSCITGTTGVVAELSVV